MGWKPMCHAATDRPVLTDDGLVIRDHGFDRWLHCDRLGNSFSCADNGAYDAKPSAFIDAPAAFYALTKWDTLKEARE
jgi:hypothetical protein